MGLSDWTLIEQTAAPVFEIAEAMLTSHSAQAEAKFTLTNAAVTATYRVYGTETGGEALSDPAVNVSGDTLTLTFTAAVPTTKTTYYISAAADGREESARTAVAVTPYVAPVYEVILEPSGDKTFLGATVGYGDQTPYLVTVRNSGNQATGGLTVALSGDHAGSFTLSTDSLDSIAVGGSGSFTVAPNTGLPAGVYSAAVTVSGGNGISVGFQVSFTVQADTPPAGSDATLSALTYSVGGGSAVSVPGFSRDTFTYRVTLPFGTAQDAVITLSGKPSDANASVTENNGVTLSDGSGEASITVMAEDGSSSQIYSVHFTTAADSRSDAKEITAFTIDNQVGPTDIDEQAQTVAVTMPNGTDVTSLTPTITVSAQASVSPGSGEAQDFTNPVTYTVTAENGTTQTYTVTVTVEVPSGAAPTITTKSLPGGTVGKQYSQNLEATGDTPITWSISAGSLPNGLTLSGAVISGTPTVANTFNFTIKALNTTGEDTREFSITIAAPEATVTGVTVSPSTATVKKGTTQQFTASVTGENSPAQDVTWAIEGNHASGTTITNGLLTVAADETERTLTVKAASDLDGSKCDTATVTVTDQDVTRYTLTVTDGSGSGDYAEGTEIIVTANAPEAGKRFKEWTAQGITLADATQNPLTVTMPAEPVELTAAFADVYAVTVTGGVGGTGYASPAEAAEGDRVTITAVPNSGYRFQEWQVVSGDAVPDHADAASTGFTMPAGAVEVKAIFREETTPPPAIGYTITFDVNGGSALTPATAQTDAGGRLSALPTPTRSGSYRFDGWFQPDGSAVTTGTVFTADTTITARWTYTGGGGSSGGGGGGSTSGGGNVTVQSPKPTAEDPNPATVGAVRPTAAVDKNGKVKVELSGRDVQSAIDRAQAQAKKNGTEGNGVAVALDLTGLKGGFSDLPLTLDKSACEALAESGVERLDLRTDQISLSLDLATLRTIQSAAGDVTIGVERADGSGLTAGAREALGGRPLYSLTVTSGGGTISRFGGYVTITLPYALRSGEQADKLQVAWVDDSGALHYLADSGYDAAQKAMVGRTDHFTVFGVAEVRSAPSFADAAGHWAENDILFVAARGLLNGTGDNVFSPDGSMTRAMFVTALYRLAGSPQAAGEGTAFTDIPSDAYYAPAVRWASAEGIVSGTTTATFTPDRAVTRQELAVIMANYAKALGCPVPTTREAVAFADDGSIAGWAKDAVRAMQQAGVLNGKDGNRFDPAGAATRAEAAAVLHRFVELVTDPAGSRS